MKRKGKLLLILLLLSVLCVQAQYLRSPKKKIFSIDVGVEHNFVTTKYFDDEKYNKFSKDMVTTDLFVRGNIKVYKDLAVWCSIGLVFESDRVSPDRMRLLNDLDLNIADYYLTERLSNLSPDRGSKLDIGLSYEFNFKRWSFSPLLGIGMNFASDFYWSYELKEKGSNQVYIVDYNWGKRGGDMHNYLNTQLKVNYSLSNRLKLLMGIKLNQALHKNTLETRISDYYDYTLIRETKKKSRLVNTLGISAGFSF